METTQGETIRPSADQPQQQDGVVEGTTIREMTAREKEIAEVKAHAEELQKSVTGSVIAKELINRGTAPRVVQADDDDHFNPSSKLKMYAIYCEPCGFKKLTDGSDIAGLTPYMQSKIPGGSPYRDQTTGQIVTPPSRSNSKKFKCPNCGRVVTVRKVADPNNQTGRSFDE